jgi:hypothetical protein
LEVTDEICDVETTTVVPTPGLPTTDPTIVVAGLAALAEICVLATEPAPTLTRLPPPAVWIRATLVLPTPMLTAYPVVVIELEAETEVEEVDASWGALELDTPEKLGWLKEVETLLAEDAGTRTVGTTVKLVLSATFEVGNTELDGEPNGELVLINEAVEDETLLLDGKLLKGARLEGKLLKEVAMEVLLANAVFTDKLPNGIVPDVELIDGPTLDDTLVNTALVGLLTETEIADGVVAVGRVPTTDPAALVTEIDGSITGVVLLIEVSDARLVVAIELLVAAIGLDVIWDALLARLTLETTGRIELTTDWIGWPDVVGKLLVEATEEEAILDV